MKTNAMQFSTQKRATVFNILLRGGAAALSLTFVVAPLVAQAPYLPQNSGVPYSFESQPFLDAQQTFDSSGFDSFNSSPQTFGSPSFSSFGANGEGQILGEVPWSGDIESVPLWTPPQPNRSRTLPPLQVPKTDAEFGVRVDALLKRFSNPPLSIQHSTPGRLLRYSLIAGADQRFVAPDVGATPSASPTSASISNPELRPIYALGALCWNVPCANRQMFRVVDGRPAPTVGFGFQSQRGELLAALAFAKIDRNYEIDVDGQKFTVQDLVDWEKRACSNDANLATVAVGLAHYSENPDETWTNEFGEEFSLAKLLDLETRRPIDWASADSTDKLLALTYLLARLKQSEYRDAPQLKRTEDFLIALKGRIWEIFGDAPLGDSLFFDAQNKVATPYMKLYVDGRLLRWLVLTASTDEIRSEKMRRANAELCALVDQLFNSVDDLGKLSPIDEESLSAALQTLALYRRRLAQ